MPRDEMRDRLDKWRRGEGGGKQQYTVAVRSDGLAMESATTAAFVSSGVVTLHNWFGFDITVVVEVVTEPQPHVVVDDLHIRRRKDGHDISARALQAAHIGEATRTAIALLTTADKPQQHVVPALRSQPPRRDRSGLDREIKEIAKVYNAALKAGRPTRAAVERRLAELRGVNVADVNDAGHRTRQARKAGAIPPTGGTTRPRANTKGTR
ncbi:MAG: hypothetical protein ABI658_14895 [Acidimicrobiales bacterium]